MIHLKESCSRHLTPWKSRFQWNFQIALKIQCKRNQCKWDPGCSRTKGHCSYSITWWQQSATHEKEICPPTVPLSSFFIQEQGLLLLPSAPGLDSKSHSSKMGDDREEPDFAAMGRTHNILGSSTGLVGVQMCRSHAGELLALLSAPGDMSRFCVPYSLGAVWLPCLCTSDVLTSHACHLPARNLLPICQESASLLFWGDFPWAAQPQPGPEAYWMAAYEYRTATTNHNLKTSQWKTAV